jgi:hypothetical protein
MGEHSLIPSAFSGTVTRSFAQQNIALSAQCMKSADENTAGITAPGGISNQEFITVNGFETEASEVLTLKLIGKHGQVEVQRPITVDLRATCQTCGKRAKSGTFCSGCGASLQIFR